MQHTHGHTRRLCCPSSAQPTLTGLSCDYRGGTGKEDLCASLQASRTAVSKLESAASGKSFPGIYCSTGESQESSSQCPQLSHRPVTSAQKFGCKACWGGGILKQVAGATARAIQGEGRERKKQTLDSAHGESLEHPVLGETGCFKYILINMGSGENERKTNSSKAA